MILMEQTAERLECRHQGMNISDNRRGDAVDQRSCSLEECGPSWHQCSRKRIRHQWRWHWWVPLYAQLPHQQAVRIVNKMI